MNMSEHNFNNTLYIKIIEDTQVYYIYIYKNIYFKMMFIIKIYLLMKNIKIDKIGNIYFLVLLLHDKSLHS